VAAAGALSNRWLFWVGVAAGFLLLLWLLNDILLPFVVGGAVAYFFDPVVVRLQRAARGRIGGAAHDQLLEQVGAARFRTSDLQPAAPSAPAEPVEDKHASVGELAKLLARHAVVAPGA